MAGGRGFSLRGVSSDLTASSVAILPLTFHRDPLLKLHRLHIGRILPAAGGWRGGLGFLSPANAGGDGADGFRF
jgi:hypothetical protein